MGRYTGKGRIIIKPEKARPKIMGKNVQIVPLYTLSCILQMWILDEHKVPHARMRNMDISLTAMFTNHHTTPLATCFLRDWLYKL